MTDLTIRETLNGGDLVLEGNDLQLTNELTNQVYLALFGGNVEQSTDEINLEIANERFDFWGNELFHQDEPEFQFNSAFERTLNRVALDTQGIQELEQVGEQDLSFLSEFGTVTFSISLVSHNRIRVYMNLDLKERYRRLITESEVVLDFVLTNGVAIIIWTDGVGNVFTDGIGDPFTDT